MEIHSTIVGKEATLRLHGEVTIYDAQQCKTALLDSLKQYEVLNLDFSEVTEIDTAGVQLLVALFRSAKQMKRKIVILECGSSLAGMIRLCNLGPELGLSFD